MFRLSAISLCIVLECRPLFTLIDTYSNYDKCQNTFSWFFVDEVRLLITNIDYSLFTNLDFSHIHIVPHVKFEHSYRTGHSPVILELKVNEYMNGKGFWKSTISWYNVYQLYIKTIGKVKNTICLSYEKYRYSRYYKK